MLGGAVDEIRTALSPREGDAALRAGGVTHVICDQWFGNGEPLGVEVAAGWRAEHPTVTRVVIVTGRDVEQIRRPAGVDALVPKTATKEQLLAALRLS
jgi:DNA-binding NarL/FixJ family response regulator